MKRHLFFLAFLATAGLPACGDEDSETTTSSASRASAATTTTGAGGTTTVGTGGSATGGAGGSASVTVSLSVDPSTMSAGDTISGTVVVTNFVLEAAQGQGNEPGHGHFHVYLDDAVGIEYLVSDHVPSVPVTIPAAATPGMHTLRISLGQNNHAPLNPPVEDIVDILVR